MVGFFFRHFSQHRSQIVLGRRLRAIRVRLARRRRRNSRAIESLRDWEIAAAEMEQQNWRIREEIELQFARNCLTDQFVNEHLDEVENDPLMRDAFERINAENLDHRNVIDMNQPRSFPGRRSRRQSP